MKHQCQSRFLDKHVEKGHLLENPDLRLSISVFLIYIIAEFQRI